MKLVYSFAQFLISEWLWSFTFAWYHPIINVVIMIPLCMYVARQRFVQSVLYAVSSQAFAVISFAACVHLLLDLLFGITPENYELHKMIHPFVASLLLGVIYAVLQLLYIYLLSRLWSINFMLFGYVIVISNIITACIIFKFLPII